MPPFQRRRGGDLFHLNPTKTQVKKPLAERTQYRKVIYFLITQEELYNLGSSFKEDAMSLLIKDGTVIIQKQKVQQFRRWASSGCYYSSLEQTTQVKKIHSKVGH